MASLPSLFIPHGAPDLPLADIPSRRFLGDLSDLLPRPRAILILSAHWETEGLALGTSPAPRTIHDFRGFPASLANMQYPARTDEDTVRRVKTLLHAAKLTVTLDPHRGYDHGVWIPLILTYPKADIPVVQISLDHRMAAGDLLTLGRALAPLRQENVLLIGSGATVHNLGALAPEGTAPPDWALDFDAWLATSLKARDLASLTAFPACPGRTKQAHPTPEHLLPLFWALGAGWEGGGTCQIHHSYSYGSIGMSAFAFGSQEDLRYFPQQPVA